MRKRLDPVRRVQFYSRWYKAQWGRGELNALIEFSWKFPQTAKSSPWFQDAVADLIAELVRARWKRSESLRKVASLLNRMNVPAQRAKRWYASTVRLYARRLPQKSVGALWALRTLRAIYGPKRQDLSLLEATVRSGDTVTEDVQMLWELHRLMKRAFRLVREAILSRFRSYERKTGANKAAPRRERLTSYVRRCWGSPELPSLTLRAALLRKRIPVEGILEDLRDREGRSVFDQKVTREEAAMLVSHRVDTAVAKILCQRLGLSLRTAYRYKPVQKPAILGSIAVTPSD